MKHENLLSIIEEKPILNEGDISTGSNVSLERKVKKKSKTA